MALNNNNNNVDLMNNNESIFDSHYPIRKGNCGIALIFYHIEFHPNTKQPKRDEGASEKLNLETMFECLGFEVRPFRDLRWKTIKQELQNWSRFDHSKYDCFAIAVMTHGGDGFLYAKDQFYSTKMIWKAFFEQNCPSLKNKPKIVIIQACRGSNLDVGITLGEENDSNDSNDFGDVPDGGWLSRQKNKKTSEENNSIEFLTESDFLIINATTKGFYAWRRWLINALCEEVLNRGNETDFLTIMTFVCQKVAIDYESDKPDNPEFHKCKCVPCIVSTLIKKIQFHIKQ